MNNNAIQGEKLRGFDLIWLLYYIIIYTFNCAFDNMQMFSTILLFGATFFWIVVKRNCHFRKISNKSCFFWYGLFFSFVSISYFWSFLGGIKHSNMITNLIQPLVFLFCVDQYVLGKREVRILQKVFAYSTLFFALVVLITSPLFTYSTLEFGSFTGMHRNTTGYVLMFACFFDMYLASKYKNKLYYLGSSCCFVVSLLTGSRKIIIGYLIGAILWAILQKKMMKSVRYLLILVLVILILVPIAYQIPYIQSAFGERLLAIFDTSIVDGSVDARTRGKELGMLLIKQSPLIGKGWNAVVAIYGKYYGTDLSIYSHNNYVEVGACFGFIGLVLFYWKFIYNFIVSFKSRNQVAMFKFLTICFATLLVLDWGQITYLYLYMISIFAILFKMVEFGDQ